MKIECPETETTMELSDCLCGPKCEHYYDTKQHRIDELQTAMQEFVDLAETHSSEGHPQPKFYKRFKELLK